MSATTWWLISAALLTVVAGLLAMAEAALASISRGHAEDLVEDRRRGASRLAAFTEDPPRYLNTAMFVRAACEVGAIVLVTRAFVELIDSLSLALAAAWGLMVVVVYVVVGVGPRTIGRQQSERVALVWAGPIIVMARVLGPLTRVLILLGNALTPGKGFEAGPFSTEAELRELVDEAERNSLIEAGERRMIHSVFELGDTMAREVMVPRTDIIFIERDKTLNQLMSLALRSGFSRIPVIGENLDDVVGIAYLKDVATILHEHDDDSEPAEGAGEVDPRVDGAMRRVVYVPDSKPADDLLRQMQAERVHVAIVVDEYGGTAGMVTIEDILEEIVGEIDDEYDVAARPDSEPLDDGSVRVSSRLHIDDLGELFDLRLRDDDVDTVGGLMAKHLGKVPIPGAVVDVAGLRLRAESAEGRRNRIGTVLVERAPAQDEGEEQ
jgi:CBS domain containing-hemolysin-like protein